MARMTDTEKMHWLEGERARLMNDVVTLRHISRADRKGQQKQLALIAQLYHEQTCGGENCGRAHDGVERLTYFMTDRKARAKGKSN